MFQRTCESFAGSVALCGAQPRKVAILVLVRVSSMKTQALRLDAVDIH